MEWASPAVCARGPWWRDILPTNTPCPLSGCSQPDTGSSTGPGPAGASYFQHPWAGELCQREAGRPAGSKLRGLGGMWSPGRAGDRPWVTSTPLCCLSPPQAYLRAVDVKILQQLVVVNEGIEAVKWLLEERSTLTSRCSSLASSQYSLVESQEASRRGSWDSLQDPNDRLDSISVGSYLDTLADDMDEYSHNAAENAAASASGRALARAEQDWVRIDLERGPAKQEKDTEEHEWPHVDLSPPGMPQDHWLAKEPQVANGYLGQQSPSLEPDRDTKSPPGARERLGKGNPDGKAWKAEADLENCKLNSKLHLEYDAHWRWLQSQDDVTFL
uniref:Leucine rich adaptor protein 1 n=1 Tax=Serinus canaria TaxID=9135 RepID=A0A8C9MI74_SERCA